MAVPEWVESTVNIEPVAVNDFRIDWEGGAARVIGLVEGQIVTESLEDDLAVDNGQAVSDSSRDLLKIAVVERHLRTGRIGLGFVRGFGLRKGAMASTIAHDAHNIVVVGAADGDMARARSSGFPSSAVASSSSRAEACRRSCRFLSRASSRMHRWQRSSRPAKPASRPPESLAVATPPLSRQCHFWRFR